MKEFRRICFMSVLVASLPAACLAANFFLIAAGAAEAGDSSGTSVTGASAPPAVKASGPDASAGKKERIKKDHYAEEKLKQLKPSQIGAGPVIRHNQELESIPYKSAEDKQQEDLLPLSRPALKALISVDRRLDPFGLEASFSEEVGLRDVLKAAIGGNLELMYVKTGERAQRYSYLSSLSKFLPEVLTGYTLYYTDGAIKLPGGFGGGSSSQVAVSHINSPFTIANVGVRYKLYQGGAVLFGALQNKHLWRAARAQVTGNTNDVLLTAARRYYELLRQEALLHIRIKAVDTSVEQLRRNTELEASGLATNLDILQARTQLARDRQSLVEQQALRRDSAILLAQTLNIGLGQDLLPADKNVAKARLVDRSMQIGDLLKLAVDNRPELKQYDELRQAAKAQIMTALAPLQPNVAFTTSGYAVGPQLTNMGEMLTLGLGVNWVMGGMGLTDTLNVQAARMKTRQALIQANKQFVTVFSEVRTAYVKMLSSEQRIEETTDEVYSAQEELRLSRLRLDNGLGTNLDVITAQRDLTQAYIDKVEALVNFNIAQAQLVHDIGLISVDTLCSERPIALPKDIRPH
jgi:outer membrane protein TolC